MIKMKAKIVFLLLIIGLVNQPIVNAGTFGNDTFDPVFVNEVDQFIVVSFGETSWSFAKESMGYNLIKINESVLVQDVRWFLEYKHGNNWKPRGVPYNVTYKIHTSFHVTATRHYKDFLGSFFNVSYDFFGLSNPKITVTSLGLPQDEYRLRWEASGINKTYAIDEPENHRVKFHEAFESGYSFKYDDVYREFGNITDVSIGHQTGNHDLSLIFSLGVQEDSFILDPTFGKTDIGANTINTVFGGRILACRYNLTEAGTVFRIWSYLRHTNNRKIKMAIYNYSNLYPSDLLGFTDEVTSGNNNTWKWTRFNMTAPLALPAGQYYLTTWHDGTVYYKQDAGIVKQAHFVWHAYNGFPDPYPSGATNQSWAVSFYANYTVAVAATYYLNMVNLGLSTEVGGYNTTVSMDLETNSTPAFYWFAHDLSGAMVNLTANAWNANGTVQYWFWLPAQYGLNFDVVGYANTTDLENSTATGSFIVAEIPSGGGVGLLWIVILIPALGILIIGVKRR